MGSAKEVAVVAKRSPLYSLFGPPPLIDGEDSKAYQELQMRISARVEPKDVLEDIWVRDVVDLTWEIFRMRRFKAQFLASVQYQGVLEVLAPMMEAPGGERLAMQWAAREPDAIKEVDDLLAAKGLTMELPIAWALAQNIETFECIDRMLMNAEARRNAALRELERYRTSMALALRDATDEVVDGEFADGAAPSGKQDSA